MTNTNTVNGWSNHETALYWATYEDEVVIKLGELGDTTEYDNFGVFLIAAIDMLEHEYSYEMELAIPEGTIWWELLKLSNINFIEIVLNVEENHSVYSG